MSQSKECFRDNRTLLIPFVRKFEGQIRFTADISTRYSMPAGTSQQVTFSSLSPLRCGDRSQTFKPPMILAAFSQMMLIKNKVDWFSLPCAFWSPTHSRCGIFPPQWTPGDTRPVQMKVPHVGIALGCGKHLHGLVISTNLQVLK